jgi:hypothetical protein
MRAGASPCDPAYGVAIGTPVTELTGVPVIEFASTEAFQSFMASNDFAQGSQSYLMDLRASTPATDAAYAAISAKMPPPGIPRDRLLLKVLKRLGVAIPAADVARNQRTATNAAAIHRTIPKHTPAAFGTLVEIRVGGDPVIRYAMLMEKLDSLGRDRRFEPLWAEDVGVDHYDHRLQGELNGEKLDRIGADLADVVRALSNEGFLLADHAGHNFLVRLEDGSLFVIDPDEIFNARMPGWGDAASNLVLKNIGEKGVDGREPLSPEDALRLNYEMTYLPTIALLRRMAAAAGLPPPQPLPLDGLARGGLK